MCGRCVIGTECNHDCAKLKWSADKFSERKKKGERKKRGRAFSFSGDLSVACFTLSAVHTSQHHNLPFIVISFTFAHYESMQMSGQSTSTA